MINTILFDLDGTLLPFVQEEFVAAYFKELCGQLVPFGYNADDVVKAVWGGTKAMIKNDGTVLNHARFWDSFAAVFGEEIRTTEGMLDSFYTKEFHHVKAVLKGESCARRVIDTLKAKGYTLVLATNPLFPKVAQLSRLSWVGLSEDDFVYVTHYQNSCFCKPNTRYYEEILAAIGKTPEECLMVGNSVPEDMVAATLGMQTYLVNTHIENPLGADTSAFTQGSLADFAAVADNMPAL